MAARIANRLAEAVGPGKYNLWLQSAGVEVDDRIVWLTVSNRFAADWIDRRFGKQLRDVARSELGEEAEVKVRIDPEQAENGQAETSRAKTSEPATTGRTNGTTRRRSGGGLRHDLEDFVVGPSNELAFAAVHRLAEQPATANHPVFLHGGCGVGKTHLLQGLCRRFAEGRPQGRRRYTTAEQFTNEYVHAVRNNALHEFRQRLRKLDLLVVDDVHFLSNKTATQTEFLHTFDAIDLKGSKVVMASDAHPKVIQALSEALTSRFVSGMVVGIHPPEQATRVRIVKALAKRHGLNLLDSVERAIAARCDGNVRDLEGMMTKLAALTSLDPPDPPEKPVGHALLNRLFEAAPQAPRRPIRFDHVANVVCEQIQVDRSVAFGRSRHRRPVLAPR